MGKRADSKDPEPLGLGAFSRPAVIRTPLRTPTLVGGLRRRSWIRLTLPTKVPSHAPSRIFPCK